MIFKHYTNLISRFHNNFPITAFILKNKYASPIFTDNRIFHFTSFEFLAHSVSKTRPWVIASLATKQPCPISFF